MSDMQTKVHTKVNAMAIMRLLQETVFIVRPKKCIHRRDVHYGQDHTEKDDEGHHKRLANEMMLVTKTQSTA